MYDNETGLYYLQSRYYDPEIGRFINCDDVEYIGLAGTVGSYNAFAYCENNPVNDSDPSGCSSISDLLNLFKQSFDVLNAILEYIKNNFKKELKTLKSTVKLLSKKNIKMKKMLKESIEQIDKISRKLGKIGKIVAVFSFIVACGEARISGKSYIYFFTEWLVECFINALEKSLSCLCKQVSKIIPSVGFVIGIFSSFVVTSLFSIYFTESKISSLATKLKNQLSKFKTVTTNELFKRIFTVVFS